MSVWLFRGAENSHKQDRRRKWVVNALAVLCAGTISNSIPALSAALAEVEGDVRPVMFVGNNWDGTVTVIDPEDNYRQIGRLNVIPDEAIRLKEIRSNPIRRFYFWAIRNKVGEGNNQLVDDMYSSLDGRSLIASRPSFADVISIDLTSGELNWRFPVDGYRADHMALSPDGREVAVSASTGNVVHLIDIETGKETGRFSTGDKPHENKYFAGGRKIINAAIGNVSSGNDAHWQDFTKGDRKLTIYNRNSGKIEKIIDIRDALDAFGRKDLSDSVRPFSMSQDETTLWFQVSFFNGVIEYDLMTDDIRRIINLPDGDAPKNRKKFVNDSRHHGLASNKDGTKLCVAGTMDEYATIIDLNSEEPMKLIRAGKPYWATVSRDGTACVISESDTDKVTVIDFASGEKRLSVDVGNHPQRVRNGFVPANWISNDKQPDQEKVDAPSY
ncbi:MAG: WD40 repeat domain-containing protein [Pseudomonadota bacterium]